MPEMILRLDESLHTFMRQRGLTILRVALGVVFFWFGALKLLGVSPVTGIVAAAYPLFPSETFITILGVWEVAIGIGLVGKILLRGVLLLLWLHMMGVFLSLVTAPTLFFFPGNPLILTVEGEFIIKNLVLVAASLVIGGFAILPKSEMRIPQYETNFNDRDTKFETI